ncbi:hypothetical protein [Lactococcus lactis]|uniref:hypothetical protein n=1 Tax=Lactococcus lactis TaxID=1358 RepID=UPI0018A8A4C2|nr:hypothetical protein [Lactococcus lactis]
MNKITMTREMRVIALCVAILEYLNNTGLIASSVYSFSMASTILLSYILFCKKRKGFSLKEIIVLLIPFIFVVLNRDPSNFSLGLMWILYFMLSKSEIDLKKVMKTFFVTSSVCFILTIVLYLIMSLNKSSDMIMWRGDAFINRMSLGFIQPNFAMMSFLGIAIALLYLSTERQRITIIFIAIVTFIIFYFTQSRTSGYILFFILSILFVSSKKTKKQVSNFEKRSITVLPLLLLIISYSLLKLPINQYLNSLLSGRLSLYQEIYSTFGIHLIGNNDVKNTMLDTAYLQSLLAKGILFTLFLFVTFFFIFFLKRKTQTRLQNLVIMMYFLIGFTETSFFRFVILFPALIVIMDQKESNKVMEKEA